MPNTNPNTSAEYIRVDLALENKGSVKAAIRFSRSGHWVQRCGSGALAAIHILLAEAFAPKVKMLFSSYEQLPIVFSGGLCGYRAIAQGFQKGLPNEAAIIAMGSPPLEAWVSVDSAYQIWIYPELDIVKNLKPDFSVLKTLSACGWIVTAPAMQDIDYVLRYFAPAFGTQEDAATGSANVFLGGYWQSRQQKKWVRGRQLSAAGGMFEVRSDEDQELPSFETGSKQWVFGRAFTLVN